MTNGDNSTPRFKLCQGPLYEPAACKQMTVRFLVVWWRKPGCDVVWKNQWEKCVWIAQGIKWNTSLESLKCALHVYEEISVNFTSRNLFLKKLVEVQYFCPFLWPPSSSFFLSLSPFPLPPNDRPVVSVSFSRSVGLGEVAFWIAELAHLLVLWL